MTSSYLPLKKEKGASMVSKLLLKSGALDSKTESDTVNGHTVISVAVGFLEAIPPVNKNPRK